MDLQAYAWATGSVVRAAVPGVLRDVQKESAGAVQAAASGRDELSHTEKPASGEGNNDTRLPLQAQGLVSLWAAAVQAAQAEGVLEEEEVDDELGPIAREIVRAAKNAGPGPPCDSIPEEEDGDEEACNTVVPVPGDTKTTSGYLALEVSIAEPIAVDSEPADASDVHAAEALVPAETAGEKDFLGLLTAWSDEAPASRFLQQARSEDRVSKSLRPKQPIETSMTGIRRQRPLKKTALDSIRARFPNSRAPTPPPSSTRWTRQDMEIYFGSDGLLQPRIEPQPTSKEALAAEMREATQASSLLGEMRMCLAEEKVSHAPSEYAAFCQHLLANSGDLRKLPVAEVAQVDRAKAAPEVLKVPLVIEIRRGWKMKSWGMSFWCYECGEAPCEALRRYPPRPKDRESSGRPICSKLDDFSKYVRVVADMDPQCVEDNYLAYPRFVCTWSPFGSVPKAQKLWEQDWNARRKLWAPPGLKDCSAKWFEPCCQRLGLDPMAELPLLDQLQLGPPGCVTRLHVENNSAHVWHTQIQGRRMFALLAPQEGANLNSHQEEDAQGLHEKNMSSPLDLFRPGQKHGKLHESRVHMVLLEPGETLVVPCGWWQCSVALETFTTLSRRFWNRSNRLGVIDQLASHVEAQGAGPAQRSRLASQLPELRELFRQDGFSSGDD
eukprot:TRINITY_DN7545_c0_g1_i1.p1 TRINITY_DN7545_c0_g1~~TRINITY_DN7545_c0_g1_i1.p1  ORF type:complete len:674 (+),score=127.73 TRINITY_DN7545_c0_g1_i1:25-2022(+)